MDADRVREINREGWNRLAAEGDVWTIPVSPDVIRRAREGDWSVVLTPTKPVPADWLGDVTDKDVLCLASGGGQQGPVLAAAGARVTVFDASPAQLGQDRLVAARDGLQMELIEGFMHDLSVFDDQRFDLIFHPVSNIFAPEILPVWRECFRVLRPGGVLLAGFMNPTMFIFDYAKLEAGVFEVAHRLPCSDADLPQQEIDLMLAQEHTLAFSHSLEDQIGGQLSAGFQLTHMFEDDHPASPLSAYFPLAIATRAVKPRT
ncbi:MAG TPA: class I SAM-dependent methyltransferase [Phenylobacterium sp.]|jgi:SAM-dependent methyltransferase|nr:class I SAM-dependent methyltransferase [Phenylobacterium sp.]